MITKEMICALREKTGRGLIECRKALNEADGDEEKAIEILRNKPAYNTLITCRRSKS